jgi:hypothetical protein
MYPTSHTLKEFASRLQRDSFRRTQGDCSGYCSECRFRWDCAGLGRNPLSLCNYNGKQTATNPAKRGVRDYESPALTVELQLRFSKSPLKDVRYRQM